MRPSSATKNGRPLLSDHRIGQDHQGQLTSHTYPSRTPCKTRAWSKWAYICKRYAVPDLCATPNRSDSMHLISVSDECILGNHRGTFVVQYHRLQQHMSASDSTPHPGQNSVGILWYGATMKRPDYHRPKGMSWCPFSCCDISSLQALQDQILWRDVVPSVWSGERK